MAGKKRRKRTRRIRKTPRRNSIKANVDWSIEIRTRDGYTCQICGGTPKNKRRIHAHHILPYAKHPDLRYNLDNGLTVCKLCHRGLHAPIKKTKEMLAIGEFPMDFVII